MGRRWVYIYSIRRNIYWFFALIQCMTQSVCMLSLRSILIWLIGCLISVTWLYTNFLCDRPLPEPHDMLDPTLKVSVNYNRERERGKREERRERKRRERKSIHSHIYLILVLEERRNVEFLQKKILGWRHQQTKWVENCIFK